MTRPVPSGTPVEVRALELRSGDRVALVGAGGKTTLLYRLGRSFPGNVLLTTTTRLLPPGPGEVGVFLPFGDDLPARWAALPAPRRALTARQVPGEEKLGSLSPGEVVALEDLEDLDLLAVEADGSARLPVKAHAPHEPVLFATCTLGVAVLGMRALGAPVEAGRVHRPELLAALLGVAGGHRLGIDDLERVAESYLDLLATPRRILVLSQVEASGEEAARRLARRLSGRCRSVVGQGTAFPEGLEVLERCA